mgnify:CR=1 FL=1
MRYRILAETDEKGFTWYYPQKMVFLFFWEYLNVFKSTRVSIKKKVGYDLFSEAKERIDREISYEQVNSPKIVKREYINYSPVRN